MIIGLAGSFGAGKGTVVEYLKTKGFRHYSASGFISEEIVRRGMPLNRDSMIEVANDLRATHGPTYIVESLYKRALLEGGDVIIESLRAIAEVDAIHSLGGVVIGIDATPHIRYGRAQLRGSVKDHVSLEVWQEQEKKESNPDDPTKQDIFGALKRADVILQNSGTTGELFAQVETFLENTEK
jgi:dephospho-CoA kinase